MSDQKVQVIDQEIESVIQDSGSKSDKIRKLSAMGQSRSQIAKVLGIRYQHVRNVLITPLKKGN